MPSTRSILVLHIHTKKSQRSTFLKVMFIHGDHIYRSDKHTMEARFNKEASEWDNNKDIKLINTTIANEVLPKILQPTDTVLELGCGTGVLTFQSYRSVSQWLGIDSSTGMIDMFNHKLTLPQYEDARDSVSSKCIFLESHSQLDRRYDWGLSSMTFHHIPDMQATITCLASCVTKGILLIDYMEYDGSRIFHPEDKMEGVERHGLDKQELRQMCAKAGFKDVKVDVGFTLTLQREGRDVQFPFLVIVARH